MAATAEGGPAWRLALGAEGRLSTRVHQRLEALWAAKRGKQGDKADTARSLKAALDASSGEPWHVVIGPEGFVTNVRYRKERCFIFANKGAALRALVFQSSPLPPDGPLIATATSTTAAAAAGCAPPKGVSVYASEWEDEGQEASALALLAEQLANVRGDGTAASVAIKAALTERRGPLWHVLVARDSVEMGTAVAAHAGSFLDARVLGRGGAHRVVIWQHDLPLSLASALRLQLLPRRAATLASITCLAVSLILTLLTQAAAPLLGITALDCNLCCHPDETRRGDAAGDCAGAACTPEAAAQAVACARVRSVLRWCALGFLVAAFVLKLLAGPNTAAAARPVQARRREGAASAGGGKGKAKKR